MKSVCPASILKQRKGFKTEMGYSFKSQIKVAAEFNQTVRQRVRATDTGQGSPVDIRAKPFSAVLNYSALGLHSETVYCRILIESLASRVVYCVFGKGSVLNGRGRYNCVY